MVYTTVPVSAWGWGKEPKSNVCFISVASLRQELLLFVLFSLSVWPCYKLFTWFCSVTSSTPCTTCLPFWLDRDDWWCSFTAVWTELRLPLSPSLKSGAEKVGDITACVWNLEHGWVCLCVVSAETRGLTCFTFVVDSIVCCPCWIIWVPIKCTSPWYNRHGWLSVKKRFLPSILNTLGCLWWKSQRHVGGATIWWWAQLLSSSSSGHCLIISRSL